MVKGRPKNDWSLAAGAIDKAAAPPVVDRASWQAELDALRLREKAHTRNGDAIAATRRRLPMVEVDANIKLIGPRGPITLLEIFEGRRQLIAWYFMWQTGQPAAAVCEGCTFYTSQMQELSYLHSRDVTYATFCMGPYDESARYRDFMGWQQPWYSVKGSTESLHVGRKFALVFYLRQGDRVFETYRTTGRGVEAMCPSYGLLDMNVYGRQETWEDSPEGWPRFEGRPTAATTSAPPSRASAVVPSPSGLA
jgi:predicted dithiol-disulfide oxidoreductase (DUF899 family)